MNAALTQHQIEIERNLRLWNNKPVLQKIYRDFYERILALVDPGIPGRVVELGSGIGNLKTLVPQAISTDLFPNPWLDVVCDGYELPFRAGSVSHLLLFDVFHHLKAPNVFLKEAFRVLPQTGRVILFEPYISLCSWPAYRLFHHEPVGEKEPIDMTETLPRPREYYAAQGNATRLFFHEEVPGWPEGWTIFYRKAFSCFYYLLSGGYSKPAFYPARCLQSLKRIERGLSRWPRVFGGRCLVGLKKAERV